MPNAPAPDPVLVEHILAALEDGVAANAESLHGALGAPRDQIGAALAALDTYAEHLIAERQQSVLTNCVASRVGGGLDVLQPGTRIGPFLLDSVLGQGGMGTVYRARQNTLGDRAVALKVLPAALADRDPRFVERFRREATLAAKIHHPNLAEVYGFENVGETLFFAMRLIEGPTLHDVLVQLARRHTGPVRSSSTEHVRRCVLVARGVADALAEIHARGLVHRDVKPSNILLEQADDAPEAALLARPVLVDFGLLRPAGDTSLTGTATLLGTPAYASHDSLLGRDLDARADVFSLAATLHDLLTSTSPETRSPATAGLPDVRGINPAVDARLAAILAMALQDQKELRYEHCGALRDELDRWLRGESLRAAPTRALGRLRLWVRRHPARAARVGLAVMLPALLLAALCTWFVAFVVDLTETTRVAAQREADGDLLGAAEVYRELVPPGSTTRLLPWFDRDIARANLYWTPDGPLQPVVQSLLEAEAAARRGDVGAPDATLARQRVAFQLVEVLLDKRQQNLAHAAEQYFVREAGPAIPPGRRLIAFDALTDYLIVQESPQHVPGGLFDLVRETLFGPEAAMLSSDLQAGAIATLGAIRTVEAFASMVEVLQRDLTIDQARIATSASFCAYRWLHVDARTGEPPTIGRDLHDRIGKQMLERWAAGTDRQALRFNPDVRDPVAKHLAFWEDDPENRGGPFRPALDLSPSMRAEVDAAHEWLLTTWREGRATIEMATTAGTGDPYHDYMVASGRFPLAYEAAVWRSVPGEDIDEPLVTASPDPNERYGALHFHRGQRVSVSGTVAGASCRAAVLTDWESPTRDAFLKLFRPGHSLLRIRSCVPPAARNLRILVTQVVGTRSVVRTNGTAAFRLRVGDRPWRSESIVTDSLGHGRVAAIDGQWSDWSSGVTTDFLVPLHVLGDLTEVELVLDYLYGNTTWRVIGVELVWDPPAHQRPR
jgi:hypothetical protein